MERLERGWWDEENWIFDMDNYLILLNFRGNECWLEKFQLDHQLVFLKWDYLPCEIYSGQAKVYIIWSVICWVNVEV